MEPGLIAIGAGLAIGIAACGSGIGQGLAAAAGAGATAENPSLLGKMLVFAALPETQAIYGFVIAILLLFVYAV
ncbi:MAG: V/A-type H+-transporting ATPase subunit K [Candidatus Woesearchaeota archaeon]|jgi:V/A-type H+-transporting ATPase subunit K